MTEELGALLASKRPFRGRRRLFYDTSPTARPEITAEALAGQPGPQAEDREWGETAMRENSATVRQPVPFSENSRSRKAQLALAIGQGTSIAAWARGSAGRGPYNRCGRSKRKRIFGLADTTRP
jgi:hypothetical protein